MSWQAGSVRFAAEPPDSPFLGYASGARGARGRNGETVASFLAAMSKDAQMKVSGQIRRWRLHLRTGHSIGELAREINPVVRGWMQYYGAFYRTALHPLLERINSYLMRWLRKKYRRLRAFLKARACWRRVTRQYPRRFAQWAWSVGF